MMLRNARRTRWTSRCRSRATRFGGRVGSEVLDLIAAVLTVMWVPSVAGCTYLWSVYLQARRLGGDQWLLQMLAIVSVPITVTVAYVSLGSYSRLVDRPLPPAFTIIA